MSNEEKHVAAAPSNGHGDTVEAVKSKASDLALKAQQQTETLRETIGDTAERGVESLQTSAAQAQEQLVSAGQSVTKAVRENPGLAIAGAVGVGVLLGLALSRRT